MRGRRFLELVIFSMQMAMVGGNRAMPIGQVRQPLNVNWSMLAVLQKHQAKPLSSLLSSVPMACWVNWLWVGCCAIFARENCRSCKGVDYRLLILLNYSGFCFGMVDYRVQYRFPLLRW